MAKNTLVLVLEVLESSTPRETHEAVTFESNFYSDQEMLTKSCVDVAGACATSCRRL